MTTFEANISARRTPEPEAPVFTPNTTDPMVSSIGGSSEIVSVATIDYGNSGLLAYGFGQNGCSGPETLAAPSAPKAGTTSFRFIGSGAPPSSLGLCLIGNVPDPLGTDVFGVGIPIYIDAFASTYLATLDITSNPTGDAATVPITIPANLVGVDYFAQAIWYWPPAICSLPPLNLSSTNALKITIQP